MSSIRNTIKNKVFIIMGNRGQSQWKFKLAKKSILEAKTRVPML